MTSPLPDELTKRVALADLRAWAELSGDFNPLHIDPEFARRTRYGRPIVHGHLSLAWLMAWAGAWRGSDWIRRGRVGGLRFERPVYPDEPYRVCGVAEPQAPGTVRVQILGPDGAPAVSARLWLAEPENSGEPPAAEERKRS